MHRRLLPLLFIVVLAGPLAACAGDTPATSPTTTPTTTVASSQIDNADLGCSKPGVVRPNCGTKAVNAGDRGGGLQYTVWALLVLGLAIVFTVVFRSAKRTEAAKRLEVGDRDWS